MRSDTSLRADDVQQAYATAAPRIVGSCWFCSTRTLAGRVMVPRRGAQRSFVCYACKPAEVAK